MSVTLRPCANLANLASSVPASRRPAFVSPTLGAAVLLVAGLLTACSGTAVGTGTGTEGNGTGNEEGISNGSGGGTVIGGTPTTPTEGSLPPDAKIIFMTSAEFTGDLKGEVGRANAPSGAAAGDALCQLAAEGAQLSGTFRAFLSDSTTPALEGITSLGPWYLLNGKKAFNNKAGLSSTPLVNLDVDEHGKYAYGRVWLGGTNGHCANWTSRDYADDGGTATGGESLRSTTATPCGGTARLYCLQQ